MDYKSNSGAATLTSTAEKKTGCIVLASGGMDSAACVDFYLAQGLAVSALHVNYGQAAARHELLAVTQIAAHFRVPLRVVSLTGGPQKAATEILGRNAFLVFCALMECNPQSGLIAIGIHANTAYFDCSPEFVSNVQSLVDGQCAGRIKVTAPFLHWSKNEIWAYCKERDVPLDLTYSCENGSDVPCGKCRSCQDMEVLRAL